MSARDKKLFKGAEAWEFLLQVSCTINAYLGGQLANWKKKWIVKLYTLNFDEFWRKSYKVHAEQELNVPKRTHML